MMVETYSQQTDSPSPSSAEPAYSALYRTEPEVLVRSSAAARVPQLVVAAA